jgi:hypothetical protein
MDWTERTFDNLTVAWHFEALNEDARDVLREAQSALDYSAPLTHEAIRHVLAHVGRRLPAHSVDVAVDEGNGTHVLHRLRAGELEPSVVLHACDPRGRPVDLRGEWRTVDFGEDVPAEAIAAIESAEHATGWLIDHEVDGSLLRITPELPDERVLMRVVAALLKFRWSLADQLEGLWRVADAEGLGQVSLRIKDGKTLVDSVRLRTAEGEEDNAATLLRWTYENGERVPPRTPTLGSSEGEPVTGTALAAA